MTLPNTPEIEAMRELHNYPESFDIVLAAPFESWERGAEKFALYDKIEAIVKRLGKSIFLPHREIGTEWPPKKVYAVVNQIVIPTSELMIAYLGLQSTAVGQMLANATLDRLPVIGFCESEEMANVYDLDSRIRIWKKIVYEDEERGLRSLENMLGSVFRSA